MRILHTMLRVGDLDRSLAFYTDVLGMKLISRSDYPEGRFTLAFVGYEPRGGGRQGPGAELELTHNWDTPAYELGTAYGHIALEVDDAYRACEDVTARGGKVVRPAGPMKHGKTVIAFVEDPDGYRIEFIERRAVTAAEPAHRIAASAIATAPAMAAEAAPGPVAATTSADSEPSPARIHPHKARTVIGQDVSYRRDPNERTYTYTIYIERHGSEVLLTSDDGWYGVKTVTLDNANDAVALFDRIVADPKPWVQEIYGEPCRWFEPLPPEQRVSMAISPELPSDSGVEVTLLPPAARPAGLGERRA